MKVISEDSEYAGLHTKRFERTLSFLEQYITKEDNILDIGPPNPFSSILKKNGYSVANTDPKTDLDLEFDIVKDTKFSVVTAFEILEHLVSPFPLLKSIKAQKLIVSVPLRLWFATAYWNEEDPYDRHYHEFEPRQLNMLLDKAGWKIVKQEKWNGTGSIIGFRPILRRFTPRHIIVYCERN